MSEKNTNQFAAIFEAMLTGKNVIIAASDAMEVDVNQATLAPPSQCPNVANKSGKSQGFSPFC
jgi:hypothetical protein